MAQVNQMLKMKRGYSIRQVADEVGVSYRTIKRRVDAGLIPAKRFGPKTTRIERKTVIALKNYGLAGIAGAQMNFASIEA